MNDPIGKYVLTPHAAFKIGQRGLNEEWISKVLSAPEQRIAVRPGRDIFQSRIGLADGKTVLVRVFVDVDREPPEVVTAYKTSKIHKYWDDEYENNL